MALSVTTDWLLFSGSWTESLLGLNVEVRLWPTSAPCRRPTLMADFLVDEETRNERIAVKFSLALSADG